MGKLEELRAKATALGYSFTQGNRRGSGYELIDSNGYKILGDGFTASLADIGRHLDSVADIDDGDIEEGSQIDPKPPTATQIKNALANHPQRTVIKATIVDTQIDDKPLVDTWGKLNLRPKNLTADEKLADARRYGTVDGGGGSPIWTNGQRKAADLVGFPGGMSLEEYERGLANARRARAEQDQIDSAAARKQPPQWFRVLDETMISIDDPLHAEKARQRRVFQQADSMLTRTNIQSRADVYPYEDIFSLRHRDRIDDDEDDYLPPDGPSGAAEPSTGFAVESKRDAVSAVASSGESDQGAKADAIAALRRGANERFMTKAESKVKAAVAAEDYAAAGSVLADVKCIIGHGKFAPWLEKAGIHERSARRWMRAADAKTDMPKRKTDTDHHFDGTLSGK